MFLLCNSQCFKKPEVSVCTFHWIWDKRLEWRRVTDNREKDASRNKEQIRCRAAVPGSVDVTHGGKSNFFVVYVPATVELNVPCLYNNVWSDRSANTAEAGVRSGPELCVDTRCCFLLFARGGLLHLAHTHVLHLFCLCLPVILHHKLHSYAGDAVGLCRGCRVLS